MLGLSACAGPIETRVTSNGPGASGAAILHETLPTGAMQAKAREQVMARLQAKGFNQSDSGGVQLQVAFSERDAAISVKAGKDGAVAEIAGAKRRKPLQSCADRELRLVVTLTRIADGAELYRGHAAEYHCKATAADVLPELIDAALRDVAAPKGSYVIKRAGLD